MPRALETCGATFPRDTETLAGRIEKFGFWAVVRRSQSGKGSSLFAWRAAALCRNALLSLPAGGRLVFQRKNETHERQDLVSFLLLFPFSFISFFSLPCMRGRRGDHRRSCGARSPTLKTFFVKVVLAILATFQSSVTYPHPYAANMAVVVGRSIHGSRLYYRRLKMFDRSTRSLMQIHAFIDKCPGIVMKLDRVSLAE